MITAMEHFVIECREVAERVRANKKWRNEVCRACLPETAENCTCAILHPVSDSRHNSIA
jgi:hypothetical protein